MARWATVDEMIGLSRSAGIILRRRDDYYAPFNAFNETLIEQLGWSFGRVSQHNLDAFTQLVHRSGWVLEIVIQPLPPGVQRGFKTQ